MMKGFSSRTSLAAVVLLVAGAFVAVLMLSACGSSTAGTSTTVVVLTTGSGATTTSSAETTTAPAETTTTEAATTTTEAATTTTEAATTTSSSSTTSTTLPIIIPGVATVRYSNSAHGFSLLRPKSTSVKTSGFDQYLPLTKTPVVGITLPTGLFHGTNLGEAGVYLGASSAPAVVANWNVPVAGSLETAAGSTTIKGVTFDIFTSTDEGAGNMYEFKTYRALHNGTCFEITEVLHSMSIGNYTPGSVVEFDKIKFQGYLETIVDSLHFTL
jgi:hypothetical protein